MKAGEEKILLVAQHHGAKGEIVYRAIVIPRQDDAKSDICDVLVLGQPQWRDPATVILTLLEHDLDAYSAIILDPQLPAGIADELLAQLGPATTCIVATSDTDMKSTLESLYREAKASGLESDENAPMHPLMQSATDATQCVAQRERLASIGLAVASVAHETRNALQRIQVHLDLLRLNEGNAAQRTNDLQSIEEANRCLWTLFGELQDFSAPLRLHCVSTSLRQIIQHAWDSLRSLPAWSQTELLLEVPDRVLFIDPVRIEQVFRNLMENAIDAGQENASLHITATDIQFDDRDAIQVTVRDCGSGLRPEDREKVFEAFYTTKSRGTGLGLPICRRIVEAHGGRIFIDPSVSDGTAFQIVLPIADTADE
ncbi:sensor histidine kinase [Rosistilla carotiformis]|uniref:sensor histidine kinase n=1 Tax=Rosistilla carotiformis TaxID=2528017 RepID=UPI0011AAB885|nr:HAMP domain-containing sensor histidine kinase [Rosistilla carotiformis]